jgi:hypothetical protein
LVDCSGGQAGVTWSGLRSSEATARGGLTGPLTSRRHTQRVPGDQLRRPWVEQSTLSCNERAGQGPGAPDLCIPPRDMLACAITITAAMQVEQLGIDVAIKDDLGRAVY